MDGKDSRNVGFFYLEIAMMLHEKVYILEEERRWAQHLIYTTKQI